MSMIPTAVSLLISVSVADQRWASVGHPLIRPSLASETVLLSLTDPYCGNLSIYGSPYIRAAA